MNKRLHRVVFNAARGLRVAVQETARAAGRAGGATPVVAAAALMVAWPVQAQIAGAPGVPPNLRPTVLLAPNGVPLVNIQTPSAAGVSRNLYQQFDVQPRGVILNNSRTDVQTQLGGGVPGNPWLANGSARIIVNEITSGNPTQLRGAIEVGGQRAEVIVANPAGIAVDGGGFINASKATLTTGAPQLNALGGLDGYVVRGGTVTIDGAGLDARSTDYAAILARAAQINAGIWANELKVVTGANQVSADHGQVAPTPGTGTTPVFALDVAQLGGMYANKIFLIGTEAGLGARNAGTILAADGAGPLSGPGEFVVTAAGRLENIGTLQAARRADITAESLANSGRIVSGGELKIATQGLLGNAGGLLEAQSLQLASAGNPSTGSGGTIDNRAGTMRQTSGAGLTLNAPVLSNTARGVIGAEPVPETPAQPGTTMPGPGTGTGPGTSTGTGTGTGTGTETGSGSGSGSGTGSGGSSASTTSSPGYVPAPGRITAAGSLLNDGGRIYAGGPIQLQTPQVNNSGGTITTPSLAASGPSFSNAGGTLNVTGSFSASVDRFDNTGGSLRAGSLQIATTGDLANQDGRLESNGDARLSAGGAIGNKRGSISAAAALMANADGAFDNTAGNVIANQAVTLGAQSLDNSQGRIHSTTSGTRLTVVHPLGNTEGTIGAATDLSVKAGALNSSGTLRAGNDVTIDVSAALVNDGSITSGRQTTITAGSLQSSSTGVLGAGIQTDGTLGSAGDLRVTSTGAWVSNGTHLAAGDAVLQGASIDLSASTTRAANVALTATQGDITTSGATLTTPGTLSVTANGQGGQTLVNQAGKLNAGQLNLRVSNLANTSGEIVQTGSAATTIAAPGLLDNAGGTIATNGVLAVEAARLSNDGGRLIALGDLSATVAGTATNLGGSVRAGGAVALRSAGLDNTQGQILGQAVRIDTRGQALTNAQGTLAATTTVDLQSGALNNNAGLIRSGAALTIDTHGGAYDNRGGQALAMGDLRIDAGTPGGPSGSVDNTGGLIRSLGTTTLNADRLANAATLGPERGIEGKDVVLNANHLNNSTGAIRADVDATLTSAGGIDNTSGLISAGHTLRILDPNAASPAAKTLGLANSNGKLVANQDLRIDAASFSADGQLLAGQDLSLALAQDIVNSAELAANGNLTYTTSGHFTNHGKLLAGQTLTVGGNNVENTANAEMSGDITIVSAGGTFTNRGLIDGHDTRIDAGMRGRETRRSPGWTPTLRRRTS